MARLPPWCVHCGGGHLSSQCYVDRPEIVPATLETPPHNGPYLGTIVPKTIPYGISGTPWGKETTYAILAGIPAKFTFSCRNCGEEFKSSRKEGLFCSLVCRSAHNGKRRRKHDPPKRSVR